MSGGYASLHRGPVGLFDFCETRGDSQVFKVTNRLVVYPGKANHWLIIKTQEADGDIEEFVSEHLKPLDTSWVNDNVAMTIRKLPEGMDPRVAFQALGLRQQPMTSGGLTPPVKPGGMPFEYFIVTFVPPKDAPATLAWPVQGCVEEAGFYVTAATSDVLVATGKRLPFMVDMEGGADVNPYATVAKWALGVGAVVGLVYLTPALARAFVSVQQARKST